MRHCLLPLFPKPPASCAEIYVQVIVRYSTQAIFPGTLVHFPLLAISHE